MKNNDSFAGMGASSIIMIFVVLCLTTFGLLSMVSAQADLRLSRRECDTLESYYIADALTDAALRAVDDAIVEARREANGQDGFEALVSQKLSAIEYVEPNDGMTAVILIPLEQESDRYLRTVVSILPYGESARYKVLRRQMVLDAVWEDEAPGFWIPD